MQQDSINTTLSNFKYLNNMACNTVVHLQILTPTLTVRLKTNLIGIDPNMSVILAIHHEDNWYSARNYIREGQGAVVRLISPNSSEASIIAFRTNIQKVMSIAGNWLVLDYPKELQKVSLRKHSRIPIKMDCCIVEPESKKVLSSGSLTDISINGCAFTGPTFASEDPETTYQLQVSTTEITPLTIDVLLKNGTEQTQLYGLSFKERDQHSLDFIQKIITHHLSLPPSRDKESYAK